MRQTIILGNIITMDEKRPFAKAALVRDGVFAYIGSAEEAKKLADEGMTMDEFTMAREQLKSGYILGQESTSSRMHAAGRRMLLLGSTRTEDEVLARVNSMDFDKTNELMRRLLGAKPSCALVARGADKIDLF